MRINANNYINTSLLTERVKVMKFIKLYKNKAIELLNKKLIKDLSKFIIKDTDFQNAYKGDDYLVFCSMIAEIVVQDLENYILDKPYLDVSYLKTEVGLIDLDAVYELFKEEN